MVLISDSYGSGGEMVDLDYNRVRVLFRVSKPIQLMVIMRIRFNLRCNHIIILVDGQI